MSDEIESLAAAVGELIKVQRADHRRIERLEQAFLDVKDILLRADEREDNWQDWRVETDQWRKDVDKWRREAEEHRKNMADNIQAISELTLENARYSGENRRDIAELHQAQAGNARHIGELTAAVAKLVERDGNGTG